MGKRIHPAATRQKISRTLRGIKRSPETRAKMSAAQLGLEPGTDEYNMWVANKVRDIEERERILTLIRNQPLEEPA